MTEKEYFSLEEAADFLGMTTKYLQKLCRGREIEYIRIHRTKWQFSKKSLDEYMASRTVETIRRGKKLDGTKCQPLPSLQGIGIKSNDRAALRKELRELCR